MRTGIYGGTFSPPHTGHMAAARAFAEQMELDELLIIPAAIPPHKNVDSPVDPTLRLRMCELAFGDIRGARVSDMEITRGGKSYTVLTLRELEADGRELFLLCGTDMILTLDEWFSPEEIFARCTPVGIRRECEPETAARLAEKLCLYRERFGKEIPFIENETVVISSSELRASLKDGRGHGGYLSDRVYEFIKNHQLYGMK